MNTFYALPALPAFLLFFAGFNATVANAIPPKSPHTKKYTKEELKKRLTPLQYNVTQKDDTERPFKNEFWDNKKEGIYVDIVSSEPLFSSKDKYRSGTGWPSFSRPLVKENIVYKKDRGFFGVKTEVRSLNGDSHLGHVFDDGPAPTGKRYCINSAALRFVPAEDLKKEGYAAYVKSFASNESENQVDEVVQRDLAAEATPTKTNLTHTKTNLKADKTKISKEEAVAIFAGGCFWCMESPFEKIKGVKSVISGYTGGRTKNPTYKEVSGGGTGHIEAVKITYDPKQVSYKTLLDNLWRNIDPTDAGGQFVDRGSQYSSAIFYLNKEQKRMAEESKSALQKDGPFKGKTIVTPVRKAETFYAAEEYHQDYYKKNPIRYNYYRFGSGRDRFLDKFWKKITRKK